MSATDKILIAVADQHSAVRRGVISVLSRHRKLQVVAEADNGREAVKLVQRLKPHLVIMDISMPRLNGLEAAHQILSRSLPTRVLIYSALHDDYHIEHAMRVKVNGFLDKATSIDELPSAVSAVHAGKTVFSPAIERHIQRQAKIFGYALHDPSGLTGREMEVIQLVTERFSTKDIAHELTISQKTVEKHRSSLMKKLGVNDIAGLVNYAMRAGISQGTN